MSDSTEAVVWQVLNKSQAVKLAQLTGNYQYAVMVLCAEAAGTKPSCTGPQSPGAAAASRALTDIVCPLVPSAITAAHLCYNALVLS